MNKFEHSIYLFFFATLHCVLYTLTPIVLEKILSEPNKFAERQIAENVRAHTSQQQIRLRRIKYTHSICAQKIFFIIKI